VEAPYGSMAPQPMSSLDNFRGMKGWMKFIGIMSIVGGALGALFSIIGLAAAGSAAGALALINVVSLALCGLGIWVGVVLFQAGTRTEMYLMQPGEPTLAEMTAKMKLYFMLTGINLIIGLVLGLVAVISVMSMASRLQSSMGNFGF